MILVVEVSVRRFDIELGTGFRNFCDDGLYIAFEDHEAALQELDRYHQQEDKRQTDAECARLRAQLDEAQALATRAGSEATRLRAEVERVRGYLDTERKCNEHREADTERLEEKLVAAESSLAAATENLNAVETAYQEAAAHNRDLTNAGLNAARLLVRWLGTLPENKTIGGHLADLLHDSRAFLAAQPAAPAFATAAEVTAKALAAGQGIPVQPAAPAVTLDRRKERLLRESPDPAIRAMAHRPAAPARTVRAYVGGGEYRDEPVGEAPARTEAVFHVRGCNGRFGGDAACTHECARLVFNRDRQR